MLRDFADSGGVNGYRLFVATCPRERAVVFCQVKTRWRVVTSVRSGLGARSASAAATVSVGPRCGTGCLAISRNGHWNIRGGAETSFLQSQPGGHLYTSYRHGSRYRTAGTPGSPFERPYQRWSLTSRLAVPRSSPPSARTAAPSALACPQKRHPRDHRTKAPVGRAPRPEVPLLPEGPTLRPRVRDRGSPVWLWGGPIHHRGSEMEEPVVPALLRRRTLEGCSRAAFLASLAEHSFDCPFPREPMRQHRHVPHRGRSCGVL
jgi:hypothetical protein